MKLQIRKGTHNGRRVWLVIRENGWADTFMSHGSAWYYAFRRPSMLIFYRGPHEYTLVVPRA